jgi:hypothetical protein
MTALSDCKLRKTIRNDQRSGATQHMSELDLHFVDLVKSVSRLSPRAFAGREV